MRFSARLPNDTATLLLLSGFIIVLVGLSANTHDQASDDIVTISAIASVLVLIVYGVWVCGYLRSERARGRRRSRREGGPPLHGVDRAARRRGPRRRRSCRSGSSTRCGPTIDAIGVSAQFAGLVVVAIAGNAVEHAVGVVLAAKGQADLAISVVKNSVAQVAAFLAPALVLVSLLFPDPSRSTSRRSTSPRFLLTVIAVWQVTGDGEACGVRGRGADRDVRDPRRLHPLRMSRDSFRGHGRHARRRRHPRRRVRDRGRGDRPRARRARGRAARATPRCRCRSRR